jgi:ribosome assembly protein SQT1
MDDGTVWMWKIPSGTPMQIFSGHTGPCTAGSFSPSGKHIVSCSDDGSLISWVPQTGGVAWKLTAAGYLDLDLKLTIDARFEAGALMSLAINPSSTVVAVGGTDGMMKLVNLTNGNILATLGAQTGDSIESLVWATTLPILAAGCVDGRIYLYDTQTYRLRNTLSHDDAVTAIVLPTGSFELTSVSIDKSVRRWDIRTGQEIARRTGHHDAIVGGLALSKDGKKAITGGDDTVALVWGFE